MAPSDLKPGDTDWPATHLVVYSRDDTFRFLARSTFRKLGAAEVLSTSFATDLPEFLATQPHLVLVDLDPDAEAALAALAVVRAPEKSACPEVPVLILAKGNEREAIRRAKDLGISGILPKPLSGQGLTNRVAGAIRHPQRLPAEPPPGPKIALTPSTPAPAPRPAGSGAAGGDPVSGEIARLAARLGAAATHQPVTRGTPAATTAPTPCSSGGGTPPGGSLAPAGKIAGGKLGTEDLPPQPNKGGGTLGDDDLAPQAKKGGGKLSDDDLAPPAVPSERERLALGAPPDLRLPAHHAANAAKDWHDALDAAGHQQRAGADVAGLDVTAILAAHLEWLESRGSRGKRADCEGMDLAGADLSRTVLPSAGFRRADLSDANLAEARLDGADFRYAVLSAADCRGAIFAVAQLRHANLGLANLEGASLRGADLSGARLGGARLEGADFDGATLVQTDLREADLSKVENLRQAQVDKAFADHTTRLPPGLRIRGTQADL